MEEAGYVYSFALLSVLIMVLVPAVVLSFDLVPPNNEMPPIAKGISAVTTVLIRSIGFVFDVVLFTAKYISLGFAYVTYAISVTVIDYVDEVRDFYDNIDLSVVSIVESIISFTNDAISAYSILPAPLITVLLVPMLIAVGYALIKTIPFTG